MREKINCISPLDFKADFTVERKVSVIMIKYKFDTTVQHLKYQVLREVARHAWEGDLLAHLMDIPKEIVPIDEPVSEFDAFKELAILSERVKLAIGGDGTNPNVIQALDVACNKCPTGGYTVTEFCRGCLAHHCHAVCPRDAITLDEHHRAHIDKSKCINCGKCSAACPFTAIINQKRPCQQACKTDAISMNEDMSVRIDYSKCIACGACVYRCPFGAVSDRSFILDAIKLLQGEEKVYAIVAPAIASQFTYAKPGQIITAIKKLGFYDVVEAALGADLVAYSEAAELAEKGFLTSSCCPAFVKYIQNQFPSLVENISHNFSPMAATAQDIKENKANSESVKTIFIGPCTAKKSEFQLPEVSKYVDCVLTFEELQALFDSRDIDPTTLEETDLNNASYYGRIFAHCGGLSEAAAEALKEQGIEFDVKPVSCNGIEECRIELFKATKGKSQANFIEGMTCVGGCINGAGCLTHSPKNRALVDAHSKESTVKSIKDSVDAAATAFKQ